MNNLYDVPTSTTCTKNVAPESAMLQYSDMDLQNLKGCDKRSGVLGIILPPGKCGIHDQICFILIK